MIVFKRGHRLLMTACALSATFTATAQSPADTSKVPAYRSAVIKTVMDRIQKKHYNPKAVNDTFSMNVWQQALQTMDPSSYIFLQEDMDMLARYRTQIDDQLLAGNAGFFEAARAVYLKRVMETETDFSELISANINFDKKETVKHIRKNEPFAASRAERKELWRKLIKYYTLRYYLDLAVLEDSSALKKPLNTALAQKAQAKVKKNFEDFFRIAKTQQSSEEQFDAFVNVVSMEFDAHTTYAGPQNRSLIEMLSKRYYGLGIELENRDGEYFVKRMVPGGSAYKSGKIREKDNIVAIADANNELQQVSGLPNNSVVNMIRGDKGTAVTMQVRQPGEQPRTVVVNRDEVIDSENKAKSAVIERNGKRFGLIRLNDFYIDPTGNKKGCAFDVVQELVRLKQEEVEGIIMDLRGNGGGSLDEVVTMCSGFMPASAISHLRGREQVATYTNGGAVPFYLGPLAVMVDEFSASASEIFSAAIQDYGRGIIIGTSSTYGKGTAQQNFNIGKMGDPAKGTQDVRYGSMRLTMEKFYRANGSATQLKGVVPDIVVQPSMNYFAITEKDFKSVMPYDSIVLAPIKRLSLNADLPLVISKARSRIAANAVYQNITKATGKLKAMNNEQAPLDLAGFKLHYQQWHGLTKKVEQLKELPVENRLNVALTSDRSIRPDMRNDADKISLHKVWLERMAKDVYVAETITVLEDILAHPLTAPATIKDAPTKK